MVRLCVYNSFQILCLIHEWLLSTEYNSAKEWYQTNHLVRRRVHHVLSVPAILQNWKRAQALSWVRRCVFERRLFVTYTAKFKYQTARWIIWCDSVYTAAFRFFVWFMKDCFQLSTTAQKESYQTNRIMRIRVHCVLSVPAILQNWKQAQALCWVRTCVFEKILLVTYAAKFKHQTECWIRWCDWAYTTPFKFFDSWLLSTRYNSPKESYQTNRIVRTRVHGVLSVPAIFQNWKEAQALSWAKRGGFERRLLVTHTAKFKYKTEGWMI